MSLARVNQKPPLRCGHVASVSRAQGTMVTMPHRPQQRDAERHASEPAHCFRRICRRPLPLNGRSTSILVAAIDGEVARHRRQARSGKDAIAVQDHAVLEVDDVAVLSVGEGIAKRYLATSTVVARAGSAINNVPTARRAQAPGASHSSTDMFAQASPPSGEPAPLQLCASIRPPSPDFVSLPARRRRAG